MSQQIIDRMNKLSFDKQIEVIKKISQEYETIDLSEVFAQSGPKEREWFIHYIFCWDDEIRKQLIASAWKELQRIKEHLMHLKQKSRAFKNTIKEFTERNEDNPDNLLDEI